MHYLNQGLSVIPADFHTGGLIDGTGVYRVQRIYPYLGIDLGALQGAYPQGGNDDAYNRIIGLYCKHTAPIRHGNRIYSYFHSLRGADRAFLRLQGQPLYQVYDVSACVWVMLAKIAEACPEVDKGELVSFQATVRGGSLYQAVCSYLGRGSEYKPQIKVASQYLLNRPKRQYLRPIGKGSKGLTAKAIDEAYRGLMEYFTAFYPSILNFIKDYETGKNNGKTVKMLYRDYQRVQWDTLNSLCKYLYTQYGIISITVHDACYAPLSAKALIRQDVNRVFFNLLNLRYDFDRQRYKYYQ